jgi:hypothetical protein
LVGSPGRTILGTWAAGAVIPGAVDLAPGSSRLAALFEPQLGLAGFVPATGIFPGFAADMAATAALACAVVAMGPSDRR